MRNLPELRFALKFLQAYRAFLGRTNLLEIIKDSPPSIRLLGPQVCLVHKLCLRPHKAEHRSPGVYGLPNHVTGSDSSPLAI